MLSAFWGSTFVSISGQSVGHADHQVGRLQSKILCTPHTERESSNNSM